MDTQYESEKQLLNNNHSEQTIKEFVNCVYYKLLVGGWGGGGSILGYCGLF